MYHVIIILEIKPEGWKNHLYYERTKYFLAEVEAPQGVEIKSVVDESNLIHFPIPLQMQRRPFCRK